MRSLAKLDCIRFEDVQAKAKRQNADFATDYVKRKT